MRLLSGFLAAGFLAVVPVPGSAVSAAPLDAAACDAATAEQSKLTDVPSLLERGPEWAKANAPPQTLKRVARWIELQEQLSFRCGRGRVTAEAQRAGAAADAIENPPPPPPPVAAAGDKPVAAKDAAVPAAGAPAVAPAAEAEVPKPAAKVKAKPKPKAEPKDGQAATGAVVPQGQQGDQVPVPSKKKRAAKPAETQVPAATQSN